MIVRNFMGIYFKLRRKKYSILKLMIWKKVYGEPSR